jgi:hypothetical protein
MAPQGRGLCRSWVKTYRFQGNQRKETNHGRAAVHRLRVINEACGWAAERRQSVFHRVWSRCKVCTLFTASLPACALGGPLRTKDRQLLARLDRRQRHLRRGRWSDTSGARNQGVLLPSHTRNRRARHARQHAAAAGHARTPAGDTSSGHRFSAGLSPEAASARGATRSGARLHDLLGPLVLRQAGSDTSQTWCCDDDS